MSRIVKQRALLLTDKEYNEAMLQAKKEGFSSFSSYVSELLKKYQLVNNSKIIEK